MHCAGGQVLQHNAFLNHAPDLDQASIFYFILFYFIFLAAGLDAWMCAGHTGGTGLTGSTGFSGWLLALTQMTFYTGLYSTCITTRFWPCEDPDVVVVQS